ncbi:MAG: DUF1906 domain-containing protein [Actinomycetota bacterium]|nr:DUF1906 domain-containing protein [Actinomycetota bacterium]
MIVALRGTNGQQTRIFARIATFLGLALAGLLTGLYSSAEASPALKTVRYGGYGLTVPKGWPVYRLQPGSTVCVRFDRHAVYLGTPGHTQRCPAHAAGRTESILVSPRQRPLHGRRAVAFAAGVASAPSGGAQPSGDHQTRVVDSGHGVVVTATWDHAPAVIKRALHVRALARTPHSRPSIRAHAAFAAHARPRTAGTVYTGPGFDACSTPSTSQMKAWGRSPYRALGVYIGGANSACAQPNLNSTWTATQFRAGWHVIPIYVGLQAPSNSCGCAAISASHAASQGTAAADDAVSQAQLVGIGPGNPIYNDMEGYARTSANTGAVMRFLAAWTAELHVNGYGSGVYSSGGSGIADLVSRYGTAYTEPDNIWVADWNGAKTTSDPYLPGGDWPSHQRLHQYRGAHNEHYGSVTINIDSDYLDAGTAFSGVPATPAAAPSLRVSPTSNGPVALYASWRGVSGVRSWRTMGGFSAGALSAVDASRRKAATTKIAERSAFPYYAVQALDSSGQVLGTSATVATRPHVTLYGHSLFVPARGATGVPAGCFTGTACQLSLTVKAGRRLLSSTGPERLGSSGGLLYFKLSAAGRRLLSHAPYRRLLVRVTTRDLSGRSASALLNLIPYATTGAGPQRSAGHSSSLRLVGLREFVYRGFGGGILAQCVGSAPCRVKTKITAGHQTVATTGRELLGANSAGYLKYSLTAFGRALLTHARGNQLGAKVTLTDATAIATGHVALSSFR